MPKMALFDSFADRTAMLGRRGGCIYYCEFYMPSETYERGFCDLKKSANFQKNMF